MVESKKNEILKRTLEIERSILIENMKKKQENIETLGKEKDMLEGKIDNLKKENIKLRSELDKIIYSRSYKITQKVTKLLKRR